MYSSLPSLAPMAGEYMNDQNDMQPPGMAYGGYAMGGMPHENMFQDHPHMPEQNMAYGGYADGGYSYGGYAPQLPVHHMAYGGYADGGYAYPHMGLGGFFSGMAKAGMGAAKQAGSYLGKNAGKFGKMAQQGWKQASPHLQKYGKQAWDYSKPHLQEAWNQNKEGLMQGAAQTGQNLWERYKGGNQSSLRDAFNPMKEAGIGAAGNMFGQAQEAAPGMIKDAGDHFGGMAGRKFGAPFGYGVGKGIDMAGEQGMQRMSGMGNRFIDKMRGAPTAPEAPEFDESQYGAPQGGGMSFQDQISQGHANMQGKMDNRHMNERAQAHDDQLYGNVPAAPPMPRAQATSSYRNRGQQMPQAAQAAYRGGRIY